ncbi:MAG: hypothetical protein IMF11_01480, partial [Proteobacteria bacterium]|nr:hypothetical protein [Pseudomonadota bacterium]
KIMKRQMFVVIMLVLACIAALPATVLANEQAWQTSIQIPVIVNIYNNSGINESQAKNAVEEASKILNQAGYKLTVVKVNTSASAGDAGNDGDLSPVNNYTEFRDMVKAGKDAIDATPNKKGIKISFVRTPWIGSTTPGWAYHDEPVVVVKNRGNASVTGQTIAHEIGHVLTLVGKYDIDATSKADESGHVGTSGATPPDLKGKSGDGNLMAPSNLPRNGTHLTPNQIEEIRKKRNVRGKCAIQWKWYYPATKEKQQHGTKTDNLDDYGTGLPYQDIFSTTLSSIDGTSDIYGQLSLGNLFSGTVNTTYALVFDSDNNSGTGYGYGGLSGMEYALELTVIGSGGVYSISGLVHDLTTDSTHTLPETPNIASAELVADLDGLGATPLLSQLYFTLPKEYIGLDKTLQATSVTEIPVGVLAKESSIIYDSDLLVFNLNQWLKDPTFTTFGTGVPTPGSNYPFEISGLEPNDPFNLYLDNILILSDTLDGSGSFSGNFVFPADLSNSEMHFLTAQDSTGEFAYSFTCPKPPTDITSITPPGLVALIGILALLGSWYIRRK